MGASLMRRRISPADDSLVAGVHEGRSEDGHGTAGTYEVTPFPRDRLNNWTNMKGDQSSPVRAYVDLVP